MAAVNKVIIIGNLGQEPEIKHTPSGQAVCNLSVATNEAWTDKQGEKQERVEWHRVQVWGKTAENCAQYLHKGRSVYVEGKLRTRSWDDKETGQKRYTTEIVAQQVVFLGGNPNGRDEAPGAAPRRQESGGTSGSRPVSDEFGGGFDDDIPF